MKITFKEAKERIAKYQKFLQENYDYVKENILKIQYRKPDVDKIEDFMYPGIFAPYDFKKVVEKLEFKKYRTPPRGNVYSNIIISGITPGRAEFYEVESTFLFGTTSTRVVLASCLVLGIFPYFSNVHKTANEYKPENVMKFIKEVRAINLLNKKKKTKIIFLGRSYKEFTVIKEKLDSEYFSVSIIRHPAYFLRKNKDELFMKELEGVLNE